MSDKFNTSFNELRAMKSNTNFLQRLNFKVEIGSSLISVSKPTSSNSRDWILFSTFDSIAGFNSFCSFLSDIICPDDNVLLKHLTEMKEKKPQYPEI